MLTARRYFQASLALPLVVPSVLGGAAFLTKIEAIDGFAIAFMFSLMLGGIPYLIFAFVVLFWSRHWSVSAIQRLSYLAPVLFVVTTSVLSLVALFFSASLREILWFDALFAFFGLIFGYLYVFIINLLYEVFYGEQSDI